MAILVLGELAAKLTIVKVLGIKARSYYDYYQNDPDRHLLTWMDAYEPHPYFGYVNPGPHQHAVTTLDARTGDDYVIGIFGGSVAQRFADFLLHRPDYQARFRDAIPAVGDRNIRLVNLAEGGYKQPQQFVVASFYRGQGRLSSHAGRVQRCDRAGLFSALSDGISNTEPPVV